MVLEYNSEEELGSENNRQKGSYNQETVECPGGIHICLI